jgi:hypothetical protein
MDKEIDTICTLKSGLKMRLDRINAVSGIKIDEVAELYVNIYVQGNDRPIRLNFGSSIGLTEEEKKQIHENWQPFLDRWQDYVEASAASKGTKKKTYITDNGIIIDLSVIAAIYPIKHTMTEIFCECCTKAGGLIKIDLTEVDSLRYREGEVASEECRKNLVSAWKSYIQ